MQLSKRGAGAILGHEGIFLQAYRDPVGIWTIGAGHTAPAGGIAPRAGMILTFAQAMNLFAEDMRKFERRVIRAVKAEVIAPEHRFDALVSFDFNTGAIDHGTVDDKLNRGDIDGAMRTLKAYVNAGGRRLAGLVTRRGEEAEMFVRARYPTRKILVKDRAGAQGRLIDPASILWNEPAATPITVELDRPMPAPAVPTPPPKGNFILDLIAFVQRAGRSLWHASS